MASILHTNGSYMELPSPILFIATTEAQSCCFLDDSYSGGFIKYHYHKEIQLTFIRSGCGVLQLQQGRYPFKAGDFFIIGENQPHVFLKAPECENDTFFIHVLFDNEGLSPLLQGLPEFEHIRNLLNTIGYGLQISDMPANEVLDKMIMIKTESPFERLIHMMELLHYVSRQKKLWSALAPAPSTVKALEVDACRLHSVFEYTKQHFGDNIFLKEVATVANLSLPAFCKFFKKHTHKTYMSFLNEVRIKEACKRLLNQDERISEIAYETGFQNVITFNRAFKKNTGVSPTEYKYRYEQLQV